MAIAFSHISGTQWTAGGHYLRNLFLALRSGLSASEQPEIVLLVSPGSGAAGLAEHVDRILEAPGQLAQPGFINRQVMRVRKGLGMWREPEPLLSSLLRHEGVSVLFGQAKVFGPAFRVPLLSWIPDFQHRHLPEMFGQEELNYRDRLFNDIARHADRIILSSESARKDFDAFAPEAVDKGRVIPFIAQPPPGIDEHDPSWVCREYRLPERFFHLPNQFWVHKNHKVVLEALALLRSVQADLTVVCTGNTNEYRNPLFFSEFLTEVSRRGLREHFIILGLVPQEHLFQLMRQSLAVLQPSLFEGWSTVVEEVKSVGKAIVLSDLPVHREQNPPAAVYFDPNNAGHLAECLQKVDREREAGPDYELEAYSREGLPARTEAFATKFMGVAKEAA